MKNLKQLILLFTLALPVAIYLFLQAFGENEFKIPVYHELGIQEQVADCDVIGQSPYLPTSLYDMGMVNETFEHNAIVLYDLGAYANRNQKVRNNLEAFFARFGKTQDAKFASISTDSLADRHPSNVFQAVILPQSTILQYGRCILQVDLKMDSSMNQINGIQLVLVDNQRRIRGYYDPNELKEIDRLNTELDILLSNQHE